MTRQTDDLTYQERVHTNSDLRGNIFVTRCWEDFQ